MDRLSSEGYSSSNNEIKYLIHFDSIKGACKLRSKDILANFINGKLVYLINSLRLIIIVRIELCVELTFLGNIEHYVGSFDGVVSKLQFQIR